MIKQLLQLPGRAIYWLEGTAPAVFFLADNEAGGVLINAPAHAPTLARALREIRPIEYVFLPSHFGTRDLDAWRAEGAEVLAYGPECALIEGGVDIALDNKRKLTRTINFLPLAGRTVGTCALWLKNLPGAVFFGPALQAGEDGWPELWPQCDDYSYESRLFGALGLKELRYEYAFTDEFIPGKTQFGPGADRIVARRLETLFA